MAHQPALQETAKVSDRYPCPCCGHCVLDAMPGPHEICPVCFWEDDGVQFRWPAMGGGANEVSLIEAQRNYQDFGACDEHGRQYACPPADDEPLDPAWRPIDLTRDSFEDWARNRCRCGSDRAGRAGSRVVAQPARGLRHNAQKTTEPPAARPRTGQRVALLAGDNASRQPDFRL
ncbi:CPCC family cysteine-rich protein [Streptomyces sp. NPDC029006]|uniref:CPCC family cysteine-rich protein n=1 Tax=Streptomyces sp. NPDC029006 TaxID=3155467 RepID=UPI0033F78D6F